MTSEHKKTPDIRSFLFVILLTQLTACGGSSGQQHTSSTVSSVSSSQPSSLTISSQITSSSVLAKSSSLAMSSVSSTEVYTTSGIRCDWSESLFNSDESVKATSDSTWACASTARLLSANGLPDHEVGTFPNANNPNTISAQNVQISYTLMPAIVSVTGTKTKVSGYALNGVKFDPGTGGSCDNTGTSCSLIGGSGAWNMEALGQSAFNFGTDENNAHVQPGGIYHYHGMPEKLIEKLTSAPAMTLVGWANDGFPIYARYGYSLADNKNSELKKLQPSYQLKVTPDTNRPATSLYAMGTFTQDYEYVAGSGDLDECNGRTGVTPEFPNGIYYYTITETYPFIQRCVKGSGVEENNGGGPPPR